jgi:hypothetical protein
MTYIPFPTYTLPPVPNINPYPVPGYNGGPVPSDQNILAAAINRLAAAIEVYNAKKTEI